MHRNRSVLRLCAAAFLTALGIVIPMLSPLKIVLPPASFTLASHVPTMMAMFISPAIAAAVAAGTALGFFLGGFPLVIVLRAAVHIIFAVLGSAYLKRRPMLVLNPVKTQIFSLVIALIHGASELVVVTLFYFGGGMGEGYYTQGFAVSVVLLVGLGTVVHSMVDFLIAILVLKPVCRQPTLREMFPYYQTAAIRAEVADGDPYA